MQSEGVMAGYVGERELSFSPPKKQTSGFYTEDERLGNQSAHQHVPSHMLLRLTFKNARAKLVKAQAAFKSAEVWGQLKSTKPKGFLSSSSLVERSLSIHRDLISIILHSPHLTHCVTKVAVISFYTATEKFHTPSTHIQAILSWQLIYYFFPGHSEALFSSHS